MVEVLVSITIIGVLVVSVLPHLITSIKGNDVAARNTQAKSLAQAELELMRNLPWNIAPEAGDYVDVFDRYFRNLNTPSRAPVCRDSDGDLRALMPGNRGYVPTTGARCPWEPTGPMYREVRTQAENPDLDDFVVVVNTQFITNSTPPAPVTPPTGYNTQNDARDNPPSTQIGVTVTVLPAGESVRSPVSTHTQISMTTAPVSRIESSLDVTAASFATTSPLGFPVAMSAGRIDVRGNLSYASTVAGVLSSIDGFLASGDRNAGANAVVKAPPAMNRGTFAAGDGAISSSGCILGCWSGTQVDAVVASAVNGLPNLGSSSQPLGVQVRQPSSSGQSFAFGAGSGSIYRNGLHVDGVLARARSGGVFAGTTSGCDVPTSGTQVRVAAGGWLRSYAPESGMSVDVCGTARTAPIAVVPTTFAPDGVVRVQLNKLTARCLVAGDTHSPATDYRYDALVQRWTPGGYVNVAAITPTTGTDVLGAIDLDTVQVGSYGPLSKWIDNWSNTTPAEVQSSAANGTARVEIPGIVTVTTQPMRYQVNSFGTVIRDGNGDPVTDPHSSLSASIGNLTCTAMDAR